MPKKLTQKQIIIIAGGVVLVAVAIFLFYIGGASKKQSQKKITLTVWGTEPLTVFQDLSSFYSSPGVSVAYTQIDPSEYENKVLAALAAGNGPDIFEVGNRDLPKWESALAPMPTSTFATQFDMTKLQSYFPSVVKSDFVDNGQVYALPLSIDTLGMIYNRDFFDSAGIASPPTTWDDFESDILKLRKLNSQGQIVRAAAAIGGSETSIADATDILSLFMLQNGTTMTAANLSSAEFANEDATGNKPGIAAFNFYLQFADASSPYYTWNDNMGDSVQSFIQGNTAIIFGYQSTVATIKAKAPFLNMAVAPMPQPKNATIAVNYPDYQGLAVSKQGNILTAWNFILDWTTYTGGENIYLKDTGFPPAQRVAIAAAESDPDLAAFASQALSARSWYEVDSQKIDSIFNSAIQSALSGSVVPDQAILVAQSAISALMSRQ